MLKACRTSFPPIKFLCENCPNNLRNQKYFMLMMAWNHPSVCLMVVSVCLPACLYFCPSVNSLHCSVCVHVHACLACMRTCGLRLLACLSVPDYIGTAVLANLPGRRVFHRHPCGTANVFSKRKVTQCSL
jgi:hypothetical protein